jgi:hypothetical protein
MKELEENEACFTITWAKIENLEVSKRKKKKKKKQCQHFEDKLCR